MARTSRHLVVDGSNIATESRTLPSLAQLDEAVCAVQAEDPDWQVTVIVDATFAHRIDSSERKAFEEANDAGEIVMPPAGAVGRGDAFILQVAEKAGAAVLSNDSFQEFHGEHPWLFEEGRLIGGKPVADVGWVFVPRVPVRGPASRRATRSSREAKKASRSGSRSNKQTQKRTPRGPAPVPTTANPPPSGSERRGKAESSDRRKGQRRSNKSSKAEQSAPKTESANKKSDAGKSKGRNKVEALNSARDFMMFVTQHSLGDEIEAVVDRFSSHGCYLRASSAQCYLPSSAMGDPPPTRARDVVALGQTIIVRVESIDSDRRGINVVLVRTVNDDGNKQSKETAGNPRGKKVSKTSHQQASVADESAREANLTRSKTIVATKKSAKKARKKPAAKKATAKKAAKATSSARATKAAARRSAAKKSTKKAAKKKATKRPAAKKAAKKTTKKAAAKKTAKKATKRPAAKKAAKKTAKKATKKKATKRPAAKKAAKKTAKKATKKATKKKATKRPAAKKAAKKTAKKATKKKAAKKR